MPGLLVALLVAGCGSVGDASEAEQGPESVGTGGAELVRVHYSRPLDVETESYGVEMDIIARGDQSRTELVWLVEDGQVEMTVLIVRDGNRALMHDAEAETPYTVMEAVDEHPEDFPLESRPLDPDGDDFAEACPDAAPAGSRTILGREAVGHACTWNGEAEGMDQPATIWLDEATGMLLEYGAMKATEFVAGPEIDDKTFSTEPPGGADVHVVKATGKIPQRPGSEDEPSPEDALATIASTSPIPVYYLGPEFEGMPLTEAAVWDDVSGSEVPGDMSVDEGQSLYLVYGEDFEMSTTPFVPEHYRRAEGCSRLRPLRGVPTIEQSEAVSLISADLVIWLAVASPRQVAPAAAALVEVGKEPTGADLPAPPGRNVALVDKACGAKPGDHGALSEE